MVDIHSHVLPFVDDGSDDMSVSVNMVKDEVAQGVDTIIATPHHHVGRHYTKSKAELEESFSLLKAELEKQNIPVKLLLGQEVNYDDEVLDQIKAGEVLTLNGTPYVLLEFSTKHEPSDLSEVLYSFHVNGYKVIVAHLERYEWATFETAKLIKREGAFIQINADSVIGKVSFGTTHFCKKLLKSGLVDCIAGDIHSFRPSFMAKAAEKVKDPTLFSGLNGALLGE